VRRYAIWREVFDQPAARKVHMVATPLLGGAGVYLAFAITVLAPLNITSIQSDTDTVTISWNSIAGKTYRLQSSTNLDNGTWTDLGNAIPATGLSTSATDNIIPGSQRFYRVSLQP